MRLNEAINIPLSEARFSSPILAFHGTSPDNLRSILSQGLTAHRAGGGFGAGLGGTLDRRDMGAVGGVYFSTTIHAARRAARTDPALIVIAHIQPNSTVADEDDIVSILEGAMNASYNPRSSSDRFGVYTVMKWLSHPSSRNVIDRFMNNLPESHQALMSRQPKALSLTKEFIIAHLERMIAYEARGKGEDYWFKGADYVRSVTGLDRDEAERVSRHSARNIPSPQEAESSYKEILGRMTVVFKRMAYDTGVNPNAMRTGLLGSTFRIDGDVGFRGNNRIVGIISLSNDRDYEVHYGQVPRSVVEEIEKGFI